MSPVGREPEPPGTVPICASISSYNRSNVAVNGPRVGIITGSGPEAGLDLWGKVLEIRRHSRGDAYRGDVDAPNVTILSVPELGYSMDLVTNEELVWQHLRVACEQIAPQVDAYAIACNTLYWYEPHITSLELPAKLISPVDCVVDEATRRRGQTFALLGTTTITALDDASPYARLRDSMEIELHSDPSRTHSLIEHIKLAGGSTPTLEDEFASIVGELDADVALLACTELPLLTGPEGPIELLDVTRLLARGLLNHSE